MKYILLEYARLGFEREEIKEQIAGLQNRLKEIEASQKMIQKAIREECGKTGKTIEDLEGDIKNECI